MHPPSPDDLTDSTTDHDRLAARRSTPADDARRPLRSGSIPSRTHAGTAIAMAGDGDRAW